MPARRPSPLAGQAVACAGCGPMRPAGRGGGVPWPQGHGGASDPPSDMPARRPSPLAGQAGALGQRARLCAGCPDLVITHGHPPSLAPAPALASTRTAFHLSTAPRGDLRFATVVVRSCERRLADVARRTEASVRGRIAAPNPAVTHHAGWLACAYQACRDPRRPTISTVPVMAVPRVWPSWRLAEAMRDASAARAVGRPPIIVLVMAGLHRPAPAPSRA